MKKKYLFIGLLLILLINTKTQSFENLLVNNAKNINFQEAKFPNYPKFENREFWNNIPQTWKKQYINSAVKFLDYSWPPMLATDYLEFVKSGNRTKGQKVYSKRKKVFEALVIAECIEGKGRFLPQIINGIYVYAEQTSWSIAAHLSLQTSKAGLPDHRENIIDLAVGEIASDVAWSYYLLKNEFDKVDKRISLRIEHEITKRITETYLKRDDFWWLGFNRELVNNWNPWCNFNVINAVMIIEKNPIIRQKVLKKAISSIDQYINYVKDDGGCEEGATYWDHAGGKLAENIDFLSKITNGKLNISDNIKVKKILMFPMYAHVKGEYFINFADASCKLKLKPGLLNRIAQLIDNNDFRAFSQQIANQYEYKNKSPRGNLSKVVPNLMAGTKWMDVKLQKSKWKSYYYNLTEILSARGDKFFFAAKGGYNNESHNHNDVGSFILYFNNVPMLVDAGVGTYTKKTFSKHRYEIWTMQSDFHNVPKINGFSQKNGKKFKASNLKFKDNDKVVNFSLDISKAYPKEAKVSKWIREYEFVRGKSLTIIDSYKLDKFITASENNFLTCAKVEEVTPGIITLSYLGKTIKINYSPKDFDFSVETIEIKDPRLLKVWNNNLRKITFINKNNKLENKTTIVVNF